MDIPALLAQLNDGEDLALHTLADKGNAAVPELRAARRNGDPRLRRAALRALAVAGGPEALDPADLAAIRRLIRAKIPSETPVPPHLCGGWYALPTGDQDAVLDAFGLSDAEPVTMRLGAAAQQDDGHDYFSLGGHQRCARVYVTPRWDGWTLVFGEPSADLHRIPGHTLELWADGYWEQERAMAAAWRAVRAERCAELSRRFGSAYRYAVNCSDGWSSWCLAEQGEVVRQYDSDAPDHQIGPPHPAEVGYRLPHEPSGMPEEVFDVDLTVDGAWEAYLERYQRVRAELGIPEACGAVDIAARTSLNPEAVGPDTRVEGHGLLALTACGREHGHPRSDLSI